MDKEEKRKYFLSLKDNIPNKKIDLFLEYVNTLQQKYVDNFDVSNISIRDYNLEFKKLEFINYVASFKYNGKVGRRIDKLVYYKEIPIGYIQLSSPILNRPISNYLKNKYGKIDFNLINEKVVDLSVCISWGELTKYLSGKLIVFCAISKELIEEYNKKYNTDIEVLFTTSIYGKSSLYNRVRNLRYLGLSEGYNATISDEQRKFIDDLYKKHFPIRKTAYGSKTHFIRKYLRLQEKGIKLPFDIPKLKKGVYVCDTFLPLDDNLHYWYNRWFSQEKKE